MAHELVTTSNKYPIRGLIARVFKLRLKLTGRWLLKEMNQQAMDREMIAGSGGTNAILAA